MHFHGSPCKTSEGFSTFDTPEKGFEALVIQVGLDSDRGDSIEKFIKEYAPKKDNPNQKEYIKFIANKMGVPKSTKLSELDPVEVAKWVAKFESETDVTFK